MNDLSELRLCSAIFNVMVLLNASLLRCRVMSPKRHIGMRNVRYDINVWQELGIQ